VGGGDSAFHALDKSKGEELWQYPLDVRTAGTPMTYSFNGRQFVLITVGSNAAARLLAFALPI
jgi:quinoprotein glucose dehydrogenase